jgi:hypothetical protein
MASKYERLYTFLREVAPCADEQVVYADARAFINAMRRKSWIDRRHDILARARRYPIGVWHGENGRIRITHGPKEIVL